MVTKHSSEYWGTEDELRFLKRIKSGKSVVLWVIRRDGGKLTKAEIDRDLRGYVRGLRERVRWGNIDPAKIVEWLVKNGYMRGCN